MRNKNCFIMLSVSVLIIMFACKQVNVFSGEEYLNKKLRMFSEITPLQKKWMFIEKELSNIKSANQKVDWEKMNDRGMLLLKDLNQFMINYAEDRKEIFDELNEKDLEKLKPFLDQSFIYTDTLRRVIIKLTYIVNRLNKMTIDPGSWTAKDYLKELEKYKTLCDEYHKGGAKMKEEFEKLKYIKIKRD